MMRAKGINHPTNKLLGLAVVTVVAVTACSEPTVIEPVQRRVVTRPATGDSMTGLIKQQQRYQQPSAKTTQVPQERPYYAIEDLTVRH